jgi:hypothetical protein
MPREGDNIDTFDWIEEDLWMLRNTEVVLRGGCAEELKQDLPREPWVGLLDRN